MYYYNLYLLVFYKVVFQYTRPNKKKQQNKERKLNKQTKTKKKQTNSKALKIFRSCELRKIDKLNWTPIKNPIALYQSKKKIIRRYMSYIFSVQIHGIGGGKRGEGGMRKKRAGGGRGEKIGNKGSKGPPIMHPSTMCHLYWQIGHLVFPIGP